MIGHRRLVLATANPDKAREIAAILGPGWIIEPRPAHVPETIEDGATLEANAIKKATEVALATGAVALADDTGLFVEALDGAPGVHSARYAGPGGHGGANCRKLLRELEGQRSRRAYFQTVIAVVGPAGLAGTVSGRIDGVIVDRPVGDDGFGYDPLFVPAEGDGRTFAQMSADLKNSISHRARALAKLPPLLADLD